MASRSVIMQSPPGKSVRSVALPIAIAGIVTASGCSARGSIAAPDIDPQAAATKAMEQADANKDGALDKSELSNNPALAAALPTFDVNGDGLLNASEIAAGLTQMYAPRNPLTEMTCTVTRNGRPLAGATVRLQPLEMLGEDVPPAEGVTDQSGTARPAISAELIPEQFKQSPLMYPGLYRVEITHPTIQLPSRYNTATELGCQVNPVARDGMTARFDLK
jgi:hypothetical protein